MSKRSLAETACDELLEKKYAVRLNPRRTHVQFQVCPYCGNSHWNFDVELEEKFVYSCWNCGKSGVSASYLRKLGLYLKIPLPSGEYRPEPTPKTSIFFNYPFFPAERTELALHISKNFSLKQITDEKPVRYGDLRTHDGFMMLGKTGTGVMIADNRTKKVRKTAADLYVYSPTEDTPTVMAVVEGFYDLLPFFKNTATVVLNGTTLTKRMLTEFKTRYNPSKLIIALDQGAEKPFIEQAKKIFPFAELLIMKPNRHSPSESQFLALKRIES
jgi:predicted RNA-binding Zn-ribbon protein involved in translation (DUF1610 family)